MAATDQNKPALTHELFDQLTGIIENFQFRAEKLTALYERMREDFKKVNIELDRKNEQLAQSLKKQEEIQLYLNSILGSMNNGVIGVNMLQRITHFNKAAAEVTGFSVDEAIGKPYSGLLSRNSDGETSVLHVLRTGKGLARDEKVIWNKDGRPVPVSFQTAMLKDPSGLPIGAVEIFSDISRIKALEEEMQQSKTMAAIGEMAATVAHEIRNPLSAMGMWATLLEREVAQESQSRTILKRILEGLSRLNRIVSNLLVYSRPVKPQLRNVALQQVLDETIDFVEIEVERQGHGLTIKKEWNASPVQVNVDPEKLQQVVMNLSLNAIQAMASGGTLTVQIDPQIGGAEAGYASFSIIDTGCGISKEDIEKIWVPFYTTKTNGTGLGLAIVKKIVESHAGIIEVKSEIDKGTAVKVYLPLAKPR
jgi:PAS domain S-box-containing protein